MAQYYQIQNLDEIKQIYPDVQLVHVAADDAGVSNNINHSQILYQQSNNTQQQPPQQYQQQTHYIIDDQHHQQQQQQPPQHQQQIQHLNPQQHHQQSAMEHHQQQQQVQQHYQPQADVQQQQQMQHPQMQQHVQQPQQQIYYTTDQVQLHPGTIIQHSPHPNHQQQQQQQHAELHQQQQQLQSEPQQQLITQQQAQYSHAHAQQHHIVQQTAAPPPPQPPQVQPPPQIVYRMQPQQQQQTAQQIQQQSQLLNNAVIVQQPTGQQVLIQSQPQQEIIMRQQPMPTQRIIYNNRIVYSPQGQTQQTLIQQSPTHHPQQQPQHIQLQTAHGQTHLVQARLAPQQQVAVQHSPHHLQHAQQQQQAQQPATGTVVYRQIQQTASPGTHIIQQQHPQQQQIVGTASIMRGGIRTKITRGGMTVSPSALITTRMPTGTQIARGIRPGTMSTVGVNPQIKGPRPRNATTGTPRPRGQAGRGGRGATAAGRGGAMVATHAAAGGVQTQAGLQTKPNVTLNHQGQQIRPTYRAVDPNAQQQQQPQLLVQSPRPGAMQTVQRFRAPALNTIASAQQQQQVLHAAANNHQGASGSSSGNFDMDLEDSIQAAVVKKEQQKNMLVVGANNTVSGYYSASESSIDDDNKVVKLQNGTVISLAEYKKRNPGTVMNTTPGGAIATVKAPVTIRTGAVPPQNRLQQISNINQQLPTARVAPQPRMMLQSQQQHQSPQQAPSQAAMEISTQASTSAATSAAPVTTTTTSSAVLQTSHNNYEIQTQHVLQNRHGQQMAEKDRNSAKMLVILVSGEQRLITFTLPRESCTVQDLLEQVCVPFDSNTTIQCVENPGANIDFVVTVGFSVQESASELISRAEQSLQMSRQQEGNNAAASAAATASAAANGVAQQNSNAAVEAAVASNSSNTSGFASLADESKDSSTSAASGSLQQTAAAASKTAEETPRKLIIDGFFAICQSCGFSGYDHAKCERCKRVFADPPKRVPMVKSGNSANEASPANAAALLKANASSEIAEKKRPMLPASRAGNMVYLSTGTSRGGRGSAAGARGGRSRRRAEAEPVILELSSDEDGDDENSNKGASFSQNNTKSTVPAVNYKPLPFEMHINEKDETVFYEDFVRGDVTDLSSSADKLSASIHCKCIRVGSYRFQPKEPIIFTSRGIRFNAPIHKHASNLQIALNIHKEEVLKIICHLSKHADSMLCLYVTRRCGEYIIGDMELEEYPFVEGDPRRRLIIQFDAVNDKAMNVLKSIWEFLDEISYADSQEVLERANCLEKQRNKSSDDSSSMSTLNPNEIRQLLIYPPGKGGISINTEDYMCLATDQYLNDIIIDFYLKWVHQNIIPPQHREKTFIFSTFFYKRLTTLSRHNHDKDVKQTAAQKRHARVQNWTKNVNLFEKDYIIIPINEQSHWFLAIVCFPSLKGPVSFETNQPVEPQQLKKQKGKKVSLQIGNTTITPLSKRDATTVSTLAEVCAVADDDSERDEAEGDESDMASEESDSDNLANNNNSAAASATTASNATPDAASNSNSANTASTSNNNGNSINSTPTVATPAAATALSSNKPLALKQPVILIFDSLVGASRSRVVATLRDYLTCEYKVKQSDAPPHIFNKDNMPGNCVKVPQQNNFTDCGLFLLQYVEQFFNDPIRDYRLPIKQLSNWFETIIVTRKREEIAELLKKLIQEKNPNQKVVLPDIPFPTLNGVLVEPPEGYNVEFEEDENEADSPADEEDDTPSTNDMDVDEQQNGKILVKTTPSASAVVPTQGRKILVKRRLRTIPLETVAATPNSSRNSLVKIRKLDQN